MACGCATTGPDGLRSDAIQARRLGFGGKSAIHPRQVPVINEVFGPTADEIAWGASAGRELTALGSWVRRLAESAVAWCGVKSARKDGNAAITSRHAARPLTAWRILRFRWAGEARRFPDTPVSVSSRRHVRQWGASIAASARQSQSAGLAYTPPPQPPHPGEIDDTPETIGSPCEPVKTACKGLQSGGACCRIRGWPANQLTPPRAASPTAALR